MTAAAPPPARGYPIFARVWAFAMDHLQPAVMEEGRAALLAGARGTVVEVGAGSGTLFSYYPAGVERVLALEPEPYLLAQAREAAAAAPVPVEVVAGSADALPLGHASVDVVVCCLVLCTVPDQAAALAEARRVLRPGGELRYLEHVVEPDGRRGRHVQRLLDRTGLWPRLGGGCHVSRDTGAAIRAAGFRVEDEDARTFGPPGAPIRRVLIGRATT